MAGPGQGTRAVGETLTGAEDAVADCRETADHDGVVALLGEPDGA